MDIVDTILQNTYTIRDLRHRLRILKSYLEFKLFGAVDSAKQFSPEDLKWLSSLQSDFLQKFNKENLSQNFSKLEEEVKKLETITIYLSFEPTQTSIEEIHFWMMKNLTSKLLVDIKFDPTLLAGAAFVYKGVYKDYSLKARIEQQGETILTEFKRYMR